MKILQFISVLSFFVFNATAVNAAPVTLKITIQNIAPAGGVALTPVWIGFHDGSFDSYNRGAASSAALEKLAEDGDSSALSAMFSSTGGVDDVVKSTSTPPVFRPGIGGQTTVTVDNGTGNRYFSYASMVLASNDYFVANDDPLEHDLSALLSGSVNEISFFIGQPGTINDAGTEINDFNSAAGNPLFSGLPAGQTAAGQGVDQNGVITMVNNPYADFMNVPAGFDLSALDFNQYQDGIAKITISAVPLPAALPLAVSGFSLLFTIGRFRGKSWREKESTVC